MKYFAALAALAILTLATLNTFFFYYQPPKQQPDQKQLEISYWEEFLRQYPQYLDGQEKLNKLRSLL